MSASGEAVVLESRDRVAIATLSSPPANALGEAVVAGLRAALATVEDQGQRVLVIRSAVPGYFAAGADLKLLGGADKAGFKRYLDDLRGVIEDIPRLAAVSIAEIDGHALGGGLELALACSMRIASPRSRLGVPEVKLGLLPGAGGTQRLPRMIGRGAALDLLLSGRSVAGEDALRMGLVERLAPDGETAGAAAALADELAALSAPALNAILRCADAAAADSFERGMEIEAEAIMTLFEGEDAREGVAAFLEKRRARFL